MDSEGPGSDESSRSKISRLENGRVKLKSRDVTDLLTLYGVTDEGLRSKFLALAMQSNVRDWWGDYGVIMPGWSCGPRNGTCPT